jgi:septal ring factor EnvC (AmiA/AmiB activator)
MIVTNAYKILLPQRVLRFALLLFVLNVGYPSFAQNTQQKKNQLQQQMKQLQQEIKEIEAIINSTSEKKKQSLGELQSLQAKIKSREKLIDNLRYQLREIEGDIKETQQDIEAQNLKVQKMKVEYAEMLRKAYHNLTLQSEMLFILSSSNFNEAVSRYRILRKVADFRRIQAKQLQTEVTALEVKKKVLEVNKREQLEVFSEENKQQEVLIREKREQTNIVAKLSDQEKKLRRQFQQKQQAIRNLNKKIELIIAEEIRLARKKAEDLAKASGTKVETPPASKTDYEPIPLTPSERALSNDFVSNRGKLPWPVTRGHIISGFGKQEHPTLKGVIIENNGIDIKTTAGSEARALFEGTVVSVFSLPTTNTCIIIKHGDYFSVYSNIEDATVKTGQKVTTKQSLGKLYNDEEENITKVHIEIWRGKEKIDPELWLANK